MANSGPDARCGQCATQGAFCLVVVADQFEVFDGKGGNQVTQGHTGFGGHRMIISVDRYDTVEACCSEYGSRHAGIAIGNGGTRSLGSNRLCDICLARQVSH